MASLLIGHQAHLRAKKLTTLTLTLMMELLCGCSTAVSSSWDGRWAYRCWHHQTSRHAS